MVPIIICILFILLILLLLFYKFWFLRNPERITPKDKTIITSPADGRIARIIKTTDKVINIEKGILGRIKTLTKDVAKECYVIVIVMTPFNVHYQRAPVSGKIGKIKHNKGKFLNAVVNADSLRCFKNENNEILIKGKINAKVIQIAGYVARRIVCFAKKNQKLIKGQRIGIIKLGSQVALILPANVKLEIKEGQKAYAGLTAIGSIK